eukprot:4214112-Amphidinium_carterae.1
MIRNVSLCIWAKMCVGVRAGFSVSGQMLQSAIGLLHLSSFLSVAPAYYFFLLAVLSACAALP